MPYRINAFKEKYVTFLVTGFVIGWVTLATLTPLAHAERGRISLVGPRVSLVQQGYQNQEKAYQVTTTISNQTNRDMWSSCWETHLFNNRGEEIFPIDTPSSARVVCTDQIIRAHSSRRVTFPLVSGYRGVASRVELKDVFIMLSYREHEEE